MSPRPAARRLASALPKAAQTLAGFSATVVGVGGDVTIQLPDGGTLPCPKARGLSLAAGDVVFVLRLPQGSLLILCAIDGLS